MFDAGRPSAQPKVYVAGRAAKPIAIDGRLDEWDDAPWSDLFVDIEGDAKPDPPYETRFKMLWDDEHLYIGAWLEEPCVWATLTERDSIVFHDNDFEVFIDPDGDTNNYYEIEINALGTVFDLFLVRPYRDGGPALHGWDCKGLRSAVWVDGRLNDPSVVDRGWSVEMAIPFASLDGTKPPKIGDQWRINFSRVEWHIDVIDGTIVKKPNVPEENWVWTPQGAIDMHIPERWGYLRFGP